VETLGSSSPDGEPDIAAHDTSPSVAVERASARLLACDLLLLAFTHFAVVGSFDKAIAWSISISILNALRYETIQRSIRETGRGADRWIGAISR